MCIWAYIELLVLKCSSVAGPGMEIFTVKFSEAKWTFCVF